MCNCLSKECLVLKELRELEVYTGKVYASLYDMNFCELISLLFKVKEFIKACKVATLYELVEDLELSLSCIEGSLKSKYKFEL